jgi:hypothetical protein
MTTPVTTPGIIDTNDVEMRKKLLELNVWAMTLILALVLESFSSAIVALDGTTRNVDIKVWAAVFIMTLVFVLLLATMVGILVLHVRFQAPYRYWYVIVDNIFITVPLYIAVRFIGASIGFGVISTTTVHLNEGLFRIGAALIALSLVFLFVRDLMVLPSIRSRVSMPPLVAVSALHFLAVLLFLSLAIVPNSVLYVSVLGSIGLGFFFAGMAAIPVIQTRLPPPPPKGAHP